MPVNLVEFHERPFEDFLAHKDDSELTVALVSLSAQNYLNALGHPFRERFQLSYQFVGGVVVFYFSRGKTQDIYIWAFDPAGREQGEVLRGIYLTREMGHGVERILA